MSNPWNELLPKSVTVCGADYEIRSDYRAILDIFAALSDPNLDGRDRAEALLEIFYPDFESMPRSHYEEAIQACFRFINSGEEEPKNKKSPRLVDWQQDFRHIVAPVNRVMGTEIRAVEYMHWWTFIAAYNEIGDCTFAQIVNIRNKLATGKKLDKSEREWYRKNRDLVDFKRKYTDVEQEILEQWG